MDFPLSILAIAQRALRTGLCRLSNRSAAGRQEIEKSKTLSNQRLRRSMKVCSVPERRAFETVRKTTRFSCLHRWVAQTSKRKLAAYRAKRNFGKTPEPSGEVKAARTAYPRFVMQKHAASRLRGSLRSKLGDGGWPSGKRCTPCGKLDLCRARVAQLYSINKLDAVRRSALSQCHTGPSVLITSPWMEAIMWEARPGPESR